MSPRLCALVIVALLGPMVTPHAFATPEVSAKGVIEQFYRAYFSSSRTQRLHPPFSQAFKAADATNKKFCTTQAHKDDVCGWDSDADPYLDAQDYDDHLTYENAVISVRGAPSGHVAATLSLFPPHRSEDALRTITYVMVREHGRWVVDDIYYPHGPSARKRIRIETSPTP